MTVESPEDMEALQRIGSIVASTIAEMKRLARPGMSTQELDDIGFRWMEERKARPAPRLAVGFPGATCISINQEAAHGIPGRRKLRAGDVVNIDVSAELNGYYADAGQSFVLEPGGSSRLTYLCEHTRLTMMKVISQLRAGVKLNTVGKIIEEEALAGGFSVIRNLCSHGVGRSLHEEPRQILPVYDPHDKRKLLEGQVITIEPFLSTGAKFAYEAGDGWTLRVPDDFFVAQYEHTIIVTKQQPIIVTL
ncbi:methionyl aminopeptidase [Paenibacillus sp. UNCCL117]|uniref:type I methionyl aminopeptidase n=1 Tax=unclassified Paenibacillus TaxID=185978 RepID=UPI000888F051|nr:MULTISPECIES: type I methionyl aminopeptidase [unclassified Paenibacillus]SDD02257.1 methionyl aminopeptidase [Paenibacillus sp. cl123]SFW32523.1 methionyl aminopeptidase [Paenibacillus sp. UNCCL117]